MSLIHLLPDNLINKIAAGEVVERPASVVKELVDNALDADAKHILVELADGGKKTLLVRDDGKGIEPDDLLMAVSRHATSKIRNTDDLFQIHTLGFRGEALASIASVSQLTLTSRCRDGDHPAREIEMEGGKILSEKDAGHPAGTTVSVKNLFFNTPARLKFLKGADTELNHIVEHLSRIALAHPQVGFKLFHNNRKILSTEPRSNLADKITDLFGHEIGEQCYDIVPVAYASPVFVTGMVGHPQIARSAARNLILLVNFRPIRDKVINHAVMEAYRHLLMHGKYPFAVVHLHLPADLVDVNVHPAKSEVRFANGQVIHKLVYDAVRRTLEAQPWKAPVSHIDLNPSVDTVGSGHTVSGPGPTLGSAPTGEAVVEQPTLGQDFVTEKVLFPSLPKEEKSQNNFSFASTISGERPSHNTVPYTNLRLIGQMLATYLVCESGDGRLVLVDQHAAHERIGFEKLQKMYKDGGIPTQKLLLPVTVELRPSETELLKRYLEELSPFGLDIDHFGGNTFVIRAVPVFLGEKLRIADLLQDLLADILETGKMVSLKERLDSVFASLSCHGAIRANHRLSFEEMAALLKELEQYPFTSFCPHGRPVAIEVGKTEIEKWFKRIV